MVEKMKYTYDDVYKETLSYFNGDDLATKVWMGKYCLKTVQEDGTTVYHEKTPDDMFWRIAKELERTGMKYENPLFAQEIYELLKDFKYVIPQGRPMAGIGNDDDITSISNCFVIGNDEDSYGSIARVDQEIMQLSKRGGGCIEENTKVLVKNKGLVKIKNVEIGDEVLSFNILSRKDEWKKVRDKYDADVKLDEQINIIYSNGASLKTSKKHPILSLNKDGYEYKSFNDGELENSTNKSLNYSKIEDSLNDKHKNKIAWLIGCHLGDGTSDKKENRYRVRILGDNESIIKKYKEVIETITESDSQVKISSNKNYKSDVWEYVSCNKNNEVFVNEYLDGQTNNKTYTCFIPKYVKENNLYIPFIAGLIDSDGYIKENGCVEISLTSKPMIQEVSEYLASKGQRYLFREKISKRKNEKILYCLTFYPHNDIYNKISEYVVHEVKKERMFKQHEKIQSNVIKLTYSEMGKLFLGYKDITDKKTKKLHHTNMLNVRKRDGYLSISGLNTALNNGMLNETEYNEIISRVTVNEIILDNSEKKRYIDIEVEDNNNYYAGEFGLVNIHNCGTDLSNYRPANSKVKNAAKTTTGPVDICANRFSNTIREVGQSGRRGALMLSMDIEHPDSEEFIDSKMEDGKITGANISLKIKDGWLKSFIDNQNPDEKNRKLWKKLVYNAWKSAEPGILFWDTVINESVPDCYSDLGFKTTSTNPCVVGETLVMLADGRGQKTFKELAEDGKDVDVYAFDNNGKLCIRKMRNPRVTGYNQKIYKVTLDDGSEIRATGNHKFLLKNGNYVETKALKKGDSLDVLVKDTRSYEELIKSNKTDLNNEYYFLNNSHNTKDITEHRVILEHSGVNVEGLVVHHIDGNSKNNVVSNLTAMTRKEHDTLHGKLKEGSNNPIFKVINDEEKFSKWKKNLSTACKELLNGNAKNVTNEELKELGISLCKMLGRRFSIIEWQEFAEKLNLPKSFSDYRENEIDTVYNFSLNCSKECGFTEQEYDTRLLQSRLNMIEQGYNTRIENNLLYVEKICEHCHEKFWCESSHRESSFCSNACTIKHIASREDINDKRKQSLKEFYEKESEEKKFNQLSIFTKLKQDLKREPLMKEWEEECKKNNVPYRVGKSTPKMFSSFKSLREAASTFNHRVESVVEDGFENVYNGTVDEFHNFFVGGFESKNEFGKAKWLYINNLNCGEIPLSPYDSCRLMLLNLYSYVNKPYTSEANFDFKKLSVHSRLIMKLMDNMIDLELEKIDKILEKVKSDPESDETKALEVSLWKKVRRMAEKGRRSGIGITAEGDMLAALGFKYGTEEATKFSEEVHRIMSTNIYIESCNLVQEEGRECFEVFDWEREKNNPFLNRLISHGDDLSNELASKIKFGRRNIALLTIAPAGSVSLMTQSTSGIEPLFLPRYMRKRKIDKRPDVKPDFVDETGDWFEYFYVYHKKFITYYAIKMGISESEATNILTTMNEADFTEIYNQSPYFGATSNDTNWVEKVKMQGAVQKWIDHSISCTVNVPEETSVDTVEAVYVAAWKYGCKGVTIYRDGSRNGVLTASKTENKTTSDNKTTCIDNVVLKRPKSIEAKVLRFNNGGEKWISVIGVINNKPYEIFTGLSDKLNIPQNVDEGFILKNKEDKKIINESGEEEMKMVSRYDFQYKDKDGNNVVVVGLSRTFKEEYWNYAKLISGLLRHNMPIEYVVKVIKSLNLENTTINSWKYGVIRTLKKFMKDEETGEKCPECGGKLVRSNGCIGCSSCGWSRCS